MQDAWKAPTNDQVSAALLRIADPQRRRAFFNGLLNPLWIQPLERAGSFSSAPSLRPTDEGGYRIPAWPEGEYLARMAEQAPAEVASVLLRVTKSDNPIAHRLIIEAAAAMPGETSASLVPKILGYLSEPHRQLLDHEPLVRLLTNLLVSQRQREALQLANAMYEPRASERTTQSASFFTEAIAGLEAYWYAETLPVVARLLAQSFGLNALRDLARWLETWQTVTGHYRGIPGKDLSFMWRPSVAMHEQNSAEHYGGPLVDAIRDVATDLLADGDSVQAVVNALARSDHAVMHRIALHVLGVAVEQGREGARTLAERWILDTTNLDIGRRHEYAELACAVLPGASNSIVESWRRRVEGYPPDLDSDLRRKIARDGAPEDVPDKVVREWRLSFRRDVLLSVGAMLPPSLEPWLRELDAELPPSGDKPPDFPLWIGGAGFVGTSSPVSRAQLLELPLDELLAMLREWKPDRSRPLGASPEGLGNELTEAVRAEPLMFGGRAIELIDLAPTYVRSAMRGWQLALGEGKRVPWSAIVPLLKSAAEAPDEGDEAVSPTLDEDPGWRWTHLELVRLVQAGLLASADLRPRTKLKEDIWTILLRLARSTNPTPAYEARFGGDNMDPMTLALNVVRGQAMKAVLAYLSWLEDSREPNRQRDAEASAPEVFEELAFHLDPQLDPSGAVRAVIGEAYPFLLATAPAWARNNAWAIFETPSVPALGDAAWGAYVMTRSPNRELLDALLPVYRSRVAALKGETFEGPRGRPSAQGRTAEHVLLLYVQGVIGTSTPDNLMIDLFTHGDLELRAEALAHLGWMVFRTEGDLPEGVTERLQQLWDWRVSEIATNHDGAELRGFGWWFRSGRFPPAWAVSRLARAARGAPLLDSPGQVAEAVAALAYDYPRDSVEIFHSLLGHGGSAPKDWEAVTVGEHAPAVIAAGLDSGDPVVERRAKELLERLGRAGHLTLKQRVDEARQRAAGPNA